LRIPEIVDLAGGSLTDTPEDQALRGEVDFFRGYCCYFGNEGQRALELLRSALTQIPLTHHEIRGQAEILFALAAQMEGQEDTALETLADLLYHHGQPHGVRATRLLVTLVYIHVISGRLQDAAGANQQLRDVCTKGGYRYAWAWSAYLDGLIAFYRNDLDVAIHQFRLAAEKRYILHVRASVDAIAGLALSCQAARRPKEADEALRLLDDYVCGLDDPACLASAGSASVRLALLRGDLASSTQWVRGKNVPDPEVMVWWLDIPAVTYCRALLAEGLGASLAQAESRLSEHLATNEAHHNVRQMIDVLALLAAVHQKQGRDDEALRMAGRAVKLAEPGGFIWPFIELGPSMADLLSRLAEKGRAHDFVEPILDAFAEEERRTAPTGSDADTGPGPSAGLDDPAAQLLTRREREILPFLAEGLSNKEIARKLHISTETVKTHLANIYQKLEVEGRIPASRRAAELGLLPRV
jgi:LuxR family maltose regulon positive regulatory protein